MKTILTERLILRPFTLDDIGPSYEMEQDPRVNQYTNDGGIKTIEQVTEAITSGPLHDYEKFGYGRSAVELRAQPGFIGFSGLKYIPEMNRVDLGYRLAPEHWGKGLATESCQASLHFGFKDLGLEEIIATILPDNAASKRVLEKLGFELEGTIHEYEEDQYLYVLTKDRWLETLNAT